MAYQFEKEIVNHNKVEDFFANNNFVGYILPDGTIFRCKNHNLSNATTTLSMFLEIMDDNYSQGRKLLDTPTNNRLLEVIVKRLKSMSHEQIHALRLYILANNDLLSDLLVSFFGCHLVTRLEKEILTSEIDYHCFYNYLLNDFKITNIGKIIYDDLKKEYKYIYPNIRNDELYEEIRKVKNELGRSNINLFYKSK